MTATPTPRSPAQRRRDTEHRLTVDIDLWVATSSPDHGPCMVPLSFDWDGTTVLLATSVHNPTGRNLVRDCRVRLGLGLTRDVVLINGTADVLAIDALPVVVGDAFAARTGFDPRTSGPAFRWFRVTPRQIQAWREVDELADRELMQNGRWLV